VADDKTWCPRADCDQWVSIDIADGPSNVEWAGGHQFCRLWLDAWHVDECKFEKDAEFLGWAKEKDVKYCPRCNCRTEKNAGCQHMTCRCGFEWWWLWQTEWGREHYDHMFDRAQVNRHRQDRIVRHPRNGFNRAFQDAMNGPSAVVNCIFLSFILFTLPIALMVIPWIIFLRLTLVNDDTTLMELLCCRCWWGWWTSFTNLKYRIWGHCILLPVLWLMQILLGIPLGAVLAGLWLPCGYVLTITNLCGELFRWWRCRSPFYLAINFR